MPLPLCLRSRPQGAFFEGRAGLAASWRQWRGLPVRWRPAHGTAPSEESHLPSIEVARRPCAAHTTSWLLSRSGTGFARAASIGALVTQAHSAKNAKHCQVKKHELQGSALAKAAGA
jgi:hypothetical protein